MVKVMLRCWYLPPSDDWSMKRGLDGSMYAAPKPGSTVRAPMEPFQMCRCSLMPSEMQALDLSNNAGSSLCSLIQTMQRLWFSKSDVDWSDLRPMFSSRQDGVTGSRDYVVDRAVHLHNLMQINTASLANLAHNNLTNVDMQSLNLSVTMCDGVILELHHILS